MNLIIKIDMAIGRIQKIIDTKDDEWFQLINILKTQFDIFIVELLDMKKSIYSGEKFTPHFIPYIIIDQWIEGYDDELKDLLLTIVSDYRKKNYSK